LPNKCAGEIRIYFTFIFQILGSATQSAESEKWPLATRLEIVDCVGSARQLVARECASELNFGAIFCD
jgi:hypothetical protein